MQGAPEDYTNIMQGSSKPTHPLNGQSCRFCEIAVFKWPRPPAIPNAHATQDCLVSLPRLCSPVGLQPLARASRHLAHLEAVSSHLQPRTRLEPPQPLARRPPQEALAPATALVLEPQAGLGLQLAQVHILRLSV